MNERGRKGEEKGQGRQGNMPSLFHQNWLCSEIVSQKSMT